MLTESEKGGSFSLPWFLKLKQHKQILKIKYLIASMEATVWLFSAVTVVDYTARLQIPNHLDSWNKLLH